MLFSWKLYSRRLNVFNGSLPAAVSGRCISVPSLTWPCPSLIIVTTTGVRSREAQKKRECMFLFCGRKAFSCVRMLPLKLKKWVSCGGNDHRMDEAWSRQRVPNISWAQVSQLQSRQREALRGWENTLYCDGLILHALVDTEPYVRAVCFAGVFFQLMDPGCFNNWAAESVKKTEPDLFLSRMDLWISHSGQMATRCIKLRVSGSLFCDSASE